MEPSRTDLRVAWIVRRLKDGLGSLATLNHCVVEDVVNSTPVFEKLNDFFSAAGPPKLLFFFQRRENAMGEIEEKSFAELFLADGTEFRLRGKCLYFVRYKNQDIERETKFPELEMGYGEVLPDSLQCLQWTMQKLFRPLLDTQDWGRSDPLEVKEYLSQAARFNEILVNASNSMQGGIELRRLEKRFMVENKQQAYIRASQDQEILSVYESVMESWCEQCETILVENNESTEPDDSSGPDTEFEFWRNRMAKFNSIAEQLKMKEHRCVVGVVAQNRTGIPSQIYRRWRTIDNMITDSLNEAKDNVKYLSILEKYTECLYSGTPATIIEALPALMSNTKMMLTIAKYYGTSERMTKLFSKITNQMIINCKDSINRPVPNGPIVRLWDQNILDLLDRLKTSSKLFETYVQQYRSAKERLSLQPKGKQFDFSEPKIFEEFDQFNKRIQKLVGMFTTIHQFSCLAVSSIEGMESLILNFSDIMKEFKRKPYDLLDYSKSAFNRDYLEYTVNIGELEQQVQNFINHSFENIISTEQALALLKKFEMLLVRDVLRATLESKYDVIFQNYGQDLEVIQRLYEKHKASPPTVRNVPPVMGNILWAQQLLHRVEDPMRRFKSSSTSLMQNSKDAKRIIKMYNKVARALIEFETLWHNAWIKSVEAARSGLQATLIIRHPRTNRLFVNFDREILQLIGEAKGLQRAGIEIPDNAKMVLSHEEKLKSYYNQLSFALKEYDRVVAMVVPVVRPLLRIHMDDLEMKIQPGMVHLTWQSMNIDSYLQKIHGGLSDFEGLVRKINDIMERVDKNIKAVSKSLLIDLPSNQSFTLEQFVQLQEKVTRIVSNVLASKNKEIGQAIQDAIHLITSFPVESMQHIAQSDIDAFWTHHSRIMYLSFLNCTKQSFFALKNRLKSRTSRGLFWVERPFFDVDVELALPAPTMNPSLEEIQISINSCALNILRCSKKMLRWHQATKDQLQEDNSYHFLIGQDYQIVAVCLMLTGAVESVKKQVLEYLQTFLNYDFLWKIDKEITLSTFVASRPTLEGYDQEMLKYEAIDAKIRDIPTFHNLGCLCLHTGPLKNALQKEALVWKALYSNHLRQTVKFEVTALIKFFHGLQSSLSLFVSDLDSAREVLSNLKDIRCLEADMAVRFDPIYSAYQLLEKHSVRLDHEENQLVNEMELEWMNVTKMAQSRSHELHQKQHSLWADLKNAITSLEHQVSRFRVDFVENGPMVENILPLEAADRMRKYKSMFQEYQNTWNKYKEGIILFGRPLKCIAELDTTAQELDLLDELYTLYVNVLDSINEFSSLPFMSYAVQMEKIETVMHMYQTRCEQMPSILRDWRAYGDLKDMIDEFLSACPILRLLSSRAIRQRHWRQVQALIDVQHDIDVENLVLGDVLNMDLTEVKTYVDGICSSASKELAIETRLETLKSEWEDSRLEFQNFKNRGPVILKVPILHDILEKCAVSTSELGSMLSRKHSEPFREAVQSWVVRLTSVADMIEAILAVQPLWIHMECIFSNVEMVKQLPLEAKRFSWVDKGYMKYVSKVFETPNVIECSSGFQEFRATLSSFQGQLELSQRSISGYLESKRMSYPRLFFISDEMLLEIVCEEHDLNSITYYLKYLFHSLSRVKSFKDQKNSVQALISDDFEEVMIAKPIEFQGSVDDFLAEIEVCMCSTIKKLIFECSVMMDSSSVQDLYANYPSQVCVLALQIIWTKKVEESIIKSKLEKKLLNSAHHTNVVMINELIALLDKDLKLVGRRCVEAMITTQIYHKGVLEEIIKKKVRDIKDFEWQKQRKFHLAMEVALPENAMANVDGRRQTLAQIFQDSFKLEASSSECGMSILDNRMAYSNEFVGCKERLVVCPVTDRIVLSICQAMHAYFGCSLIGWSGTGKTCTMRDFAISMGKYLVVCNCSESMCSKDVERMMKGLAMSGLWGLFDDFLRIAPNLMSVAAFHMSSILTALREQRKEFVFTDSQILSLRAGCSFTLTSSFGEQDGTNTDRHFPENLKVLFRCTGVTPPSKFTVAQVKLSACGFEEHVSLAKIIDVLYDLCKERLSEPINCSFNLQNMILVINYAQIAKYEQKDRTERQVFAQALRDVHCSRLLDSHLQIFLGVLGDFFPDVVTELYPRDKHRNGIQGIMNATDLLKLKIEIREPAHLLVGKALQLQQLTLCRHSFSVVGPAGAGKSLVIQILSTLQGSTSRHRLWRIFPGSLTGHQFVGGLNSSTNEWEDGIVPIMLRKMAKSSDLLSWLLFDGPITSWIDFLSSSLDENRSFHVGNSDRIVLTSNIKIAFETENLMHLSPSIGSRMEFIFIPQDCVGCDTLIASWFQERVCMATPLKRLLQTVVSVFGGSRFSKRIGNSTTYSLNISATTMIKRMLIFLTGVIDAYPNSAESSELCIRRLALFAICWSIGGLNDEDGRKQFDVEIRKAVDVEIQPPSDFTCFNYYVEDGEWQPWTNASESWRGPDNLSDCISSFVVPTVESQQVTFIFNLLLSREIPAILTGYSGSGKSLFALNCINRLKSNNHAAVIHQFSYATSPRMLQSCLEKGLEKRYGSSFGPHGLKKRIFLIEDIHVPELKKFESKEMIRQLLQEKGFYDSKRMGAWKCLIDHSYAASMTLPKDSGIVTELIPSRLCRLFFPVHVLSPSSTSMVSVFGPLFKSYFSTEQMGNEIGSIVNKLSEVSISLWGKLCEFADSNLAPLYSFVHSGRSLIRLLQGMIKCDRDSIVTRDFMLRLWVHECKRTFGDSLMTAESQQVVYDTILQHLEEAKFFGGLSSSAAPAGLHKTVDSTNIKDSPRIFRPTVGQNRGVRKTNTIDMRTAIYFCSFALKAERDEFDDASKFQSQPFYELAAGLDSVKSRLQDFTVQYNGSVPKSFELRITLFPFAIEQLLKILRVLTTSGGHCLCFGGTGKRALTKLASFIANQVIISLNSSFPWKPEDASNQVQNICKILASESKDVTCVVPAASYSNLEFWGFICSLLVPEDDIWIFETTNRENAFSGVLDPPVHDGSDPLATDRRAKFARQNQMRLHIVFCFSRENEVYHICEKYPAIIKNCHLIYFLDWSNESMEEVAKSQLESFGLSLPALTIPTEPIALCMPAICQSAVDCHNIYGQSWENQKIQLYLDLLEHFKKVYFEQSKSLTMTKNKIELSLETLQSVMEDIDFLKNEIEEFEITINDTEELTVNLLKKIAKQSLNEEKKRSDLQLLQNSIKIKQNTVQRLKNEIDSDINKASPALLEAQQMLQRVGVKDLQTLKGLKSPPSVVKVMFDIALLLLNRPVSRIQVVEEKGQMFYKDSFALAAPIVFETAFMEDLVTFPKDSITDETIELMQPYLESPLFNIDMAKKVSAVSFAICLWIKAMISYHDISSSIKPQLQTLLKMEADLGSLEMKYATAELDANITHAEIESMQSQLLHAVEEKKGIQGTIDLTARKIQSAKALLASLDEHANVWKERLSSVSSRITLLAGDSTLAAAVLTFCGPAEKLLREKITRGTLSILEMRNLECSPNGSISDMYMNRHERNLLKSLFLSSSESVQNIVLLKHSTSWPLVFDPQGHAIRWILFHEVENNPKQITADKLDIDLMTDCMIHGKALIIENISERLDHHLCWLIAKLSRLRSKCHNVEIDHDKFIDCNENFKLYLTTVDFKLKSTCTLNGFRIPVLNFFQSEEDFHEQLLSLVVLAESPGVAARQCAIISELALQEKSIFIQDQGIIETLANSDGNLVGNSQTVDNIISAAKSLSDCKEVLKRVDETSKKLLAAADTSKKVADAGVMLHHLTAEMNSVDKVYTMSMHQFQSVFKTAIESCCSNLSASARNNTLIDDVIFMVSKVILAGLFEQHRDIFLLLLVFRLQVSAGHIKKDQVECFVMNGTSQSESSRRKPYGWIPDYTWAICMHCSFLIPAFKDLPDSVQRLGDQWKAWCEAESPEGTPLPEISSVRNGRMERINLLILVRAFRMDRVRHIVHQYILESLGSKYMVSRSAMMEVGFAASSAKIPILCIYTPGSELNQSILLLSKRMRKTVRFVVLGQGQESQALRHVDMSISIGNWIVLDNAQISPGLLLDIEHNLNNTGTIEQEFRLWLAVSTQSFIPMRLLQISIKICCEAPTGIKECLGYCHACFGSDFEESNSWQFKALALMLCLFHSTIQSRVRYGKIGWRQHYDFNSADFMSCASILQIARDDMQKKVKDSHWDKLKFLMTEIIYGGKMVDDMDRRVLISYADVFINPSILDANHNIFKDVSVFNLSESGQSLTQVIDKLSLSDKPENIGLPFGSEFAGNLQTAQSMLGILGSILSMNVVDSDSRSNSNTNSTESILSDLLGKIPPSFSPAAGLAKGVSPIDAVFKHEIEYQQLIRDTLSAILNRLQLIDAGLMHADEVSTEALKDIRLNKVPRLLMNMASLPQMMSTWMESLLLRHEQCAKWLEKGRPHAYWLGGFERPSALIAAVRQEAARSHRATPGWALEDLTVYGEVTKLESVSDVKGTAEDGIYAYGMYLQGGGTWNKKESKLSELSFSALSSAKGVGIYGLPLPVFYIGAVPRSLVKNEDLQTFECPIYASGVENAFPLCHSFMKSVHSTSYAGW